MWVGLLAAFLAACTPGDLKYTMYGSGGGEAIDIAIKTARNAMRKRKIVSIVKAYHGHTGLAVKTGDERFSKLFLSEDTAGEFVQVPFNDLNAMEDALKGRDVAAAGRVGVVGLRLLCQRGRGEEGEEGGESDPSG